MSVAIGVVEQKLGFLTKIPGFLPLNLVRIRSATCVDFLNGCVRCRIEFSIEWCQFQQGLSRKKFGFGLKYWVFDPVLVLKRVRIRFTTCIDFLNGYVRYRIEFSID